MIPYALLGCTLQSFQSCDLVGSLPLLARSMPVNYATLFQFRHPKTPFALSGLLRYCCIGVRQHYAEIIERSRRHISISTSFDVEEKLLA